MVDHVTYGTTSRFNHWLTALVVLGLLTSGFLLEYIEFADEQARSLRGTHQATGFLFFLFALWRVGWRMVNGFPRPAGTMARWQVQAAKLVHWALIFCILAMPLTGMARGLLRDRDLDVFGLFALPALANQPELARSAAQAHGLVAWLLVALLALHVAAALKHHLLDRDTTLLRMLRGGQPIND